MSLTERRGESVPVCVCLCLFMYVRLCFFFSLCAFTSRSACQCNCVSLKDVKLENTHSLRPGTYRSSSSTASFHFQPLQQSNQVASPSLLSPPSVTSNPCLPLMKYVTTDMHLNVNADRSCSFMLLPRVSVRESEEI